MGNYKIDEKRFNKIRDKVEPYRSIGHICKNVRCIETGQIFENARKAAEWVAYVQERGYCHTDLIKRACRKKGTCFGYHWEFTK